MLNLHYHLSVIAHKFHKLVYFCNYLLLQSDLEFGQKYKKNFFVDVGTQLNETSFTSRKAKMLYHHLISKDRGS